MIYLNKMLYTVIHLTYSLKIYEERKKVLIYNIYINTNLT